MYHYQHSWPNFADTLSRVKTHWLPCFPTCFPPAIVHCVPHSIGYRHLICHYRLSLYWQTSLMLLSSPFPTATTGFPLPSKPHAPLSSLSPMSIIWDPPPQSSTYVANTPPPPLPFSPLKWPQYLDPPLWAYFPSVTHLEHYRLTP